MAVTGNISQMAFRATANGSGVTVTDPYVTIEQTADGAVVTVTDAQGSTTATIYNGVGIESIEKTSTEGLVDTYTITFTDGTTTTYTVTNGQSYTVDSELSDTSENPVQNKVLNAAIPKNIKDGTGTGAVVEGMISDDIPVANQTTASGDYSHAEGGATGMDAETGEEYFVGNVASGYASHAEGGGTTSSGYTSHAEGDLTTSNGYASHAEGSMTTASGKTAHSQNTGTTAQGRSQTVIGEYNVAQGSAQTKASTDYAFIVGNGTRNNARSNAFALRWDGAFVLANGTVLTASELASVATLYTTLTSGTDGQLLVSDGNGGFRWLNLADISIYPGGLVE